MWFAVKQLMPSSALHPALLKVVESHSYSAALDYHSQAAVLVSRRALLQALRLTPPPPPPWPEPVGVSGTKPCRNPLPTSLRHLNLDLETIGHRLYQRNLTQQAMSPRHSTTHYV